MWNKHKAKHNPLYKNQDLLNKVKNHIAHKIAIVDHKEVDALKQLLVKNQADENFILQIGDCAEDTSKNTKEYSYNQFVFINSLAKELQNTLGTKVLKIGRIAGQLAKPRSENYEDKEKQVLNYFGDLINSPVFNQNLRQADPLRILKGYVFSKQVANHLKNFSLKANLQSDDFIFTSHEMLLLHYEEALTKLINGKNYNLSAHNLWIGDRTKESDNAHAYFASLIQNPIGIKVGPKTDLQDLKQTIFKINPNNEKGKINIITRFGCENVFFLKELVAMLSRNNINHSLLADPMHGNNKVVFNKKVRLVDEIIKEVSLIKNTLESLGKKLNGIHLEASVFSEKECFYNKEDCINQIKPLCDPRLSAMQSFDLIKNVFKN